MKATITVIYNTAGFSTLAVAIKNDVSANTDPSSDTNVTIQATTISVSVTVIVATTVCPTGQTLVSGVCATPAVVTCPSGQTLVGGVCTTPAPSGGGTNSNSPLVGTWTATATTLSETITASTCGGTTGTTVIIPYAISGTTLTLGANAVTLTKQSSTASNDPYIGTWVSNGNPCSAPPPF